MAALIRASKKSDNRCNIPIEFGLDSKKEFVSGLSLTPLFGSSDIKDGEMDENGSRIVDSGDSVHSLRSSNGSPVNSVGMQAKGGISRPPGLGGVSMPSPIGKPGHSYTSSASTAQNLTLTPTSSLDGGELSYIRQSSPFHGDGPSLTSDPPGFGSFDGEDGDHDGLLGLQALPRDRAHSSPGPMGPYSSSPPVRPGQSYGASFEDGRPLRPRAVSRDNGRSQSGASRPPLSGGAGLSPQVTEGKSYFSSSGSRSRDQSPTPPGIISRPGNQPFDVPHDPLMVSRRRSIGSENGYEYAHYAERNQPGMDQLAQQFSQMGNQQGYRPVQPGLQRHQRATSMPGLMRDEGYPPERYHEEIPHQNIARRGSDHGIGMTSSAYGSGEYSDPRYNPHAPQYDQMGRPQMITQRRTSLQSVPGSTSDFYGRNFNRRESLDFVPGHNRYPDGVPVVASNSEMRMYIGDDRGSYRSAPPQSPMHNHYGGSHHSRNPSLDMASTLSSSPASMSSTGVRGVPDMYGGRGRHRVTPSDDDLSHPLAGEHIDVSGDERGYPPNDIMQAPPRGRPEQPLPHYGGAAAAHVLPATGPSAPMPKVVYNIKFKRTQRVFVLGPRLNRDLKIGTYVKVEADRGEDLGIVIGRVPSDKYLASRSSFRGEMGSLPPPSGVGPGGSADLKRIIRLATHDEVALLTMKREEEDELLKICRTKVRQRGLPMNVVDAEYQFDRHKLTFFFEAEGRVDFRELVRDLFSMYKTRIWMQQLDKTTSATCPVAPEEPEDLDMDYGTPIIAPESEYSDFAGGAGGGGD